MKLKKYTILSLIVVSLAGNMWGCGLKEDNNHSGNQKKQTAADRQTEKNVQHKDEGQPKSVMADYAQIFQSIQGCAVILDIPENEYRIYNEKQCKTQVSPCSTFKVISSLMGLHNQVITSGESKMGYDGTNYPMESWNEDLGLKDAFQNSCVWYFRKILDQVGQEEIRKELESLNYGNCDISKWEGDGVNALPELNGFWLESSLKISPLEQVQVLQNIMEGSTVYTQSEIEVLKSIMLTETNGAEKIYGKTGTGTAGNAWFVGFTEKEGKVNQYFAVYLSDETSDEVSGAKAKEIALDILNQ